MITFKDVKEKTPELEQFLIEVAKTTGAEEAILFDGTVISLASESTGITGINLVNKGGEGA